jgi:hypothetical protein
MILYLPSFSGTESLIAPSFLRYANSLLARGG